VLDTETTGLRGFACEVSVYDGSEFPIDTLVNPKALIEAGAQKVHGLTAEMLAGSPEFGEIWGALGQVIADRRVIVWNASFDSGVIRREVERLGLPVPPMPWECAMARYSDWYYDERNSRFMRLNGGHRAGEDCKAVFDRLREMAGE
jgi:DNA polymerase III epsilon subunit-like protein